MELLTSKQYTEQMECVVLSEHGITAIGTTLLAKSQSEITLNSSVYGEDSVLGRDLKASNVELLRHSSLQAEPSQ